MILSRLNDQIDDRENNPLYNVFIILFALVHKLKAESYEITPDVVRESAEACGVEVAKDVARQAGLSEDFINTALKSKGNDA